MCDNTILGIYCNNTPCDYDFECFSSVCNSGICFDLNSDSFEEDDFTIEDDFIEEDDSTEANDGPCYIKSVNNLLPYCKGETCNYHDDCFSGMCINGTCGD